MMRAGKTQTRQRGVALITALLILAIATTAAAFLVQQLNLSIRRSGNIINSNQTYLYALGAETLAIIGLNEDAKDNKIDSYDDIWSMEFDPFPVEDGAGFIYVKVSDLQARFNVNNLIKDGRQDTVSIERFRRLLTLYDIDPEVCNAVIDWIDTDIDTQGTYGAEDDYYMGLEPPYRAANRKLTSVSELRQVRGLDTAEHFHKLVQQLIALPERTAINVNFAGYEIQYAIIGDVQKAMQAVRHSQFMLEQTQAGAEEQPTDLLEISEPATNEHVLQRPFITPSAESVIPYNDIDDYIARNNLQEDIKTNKVSKEDLSPNSRYFLVLGESELDRGRTSIKSVLHRDANGKIYILSRTLGDL
ncbi:MAG: type II secretion system minor pseudopilin GspK [Gammaproteobacteria bacterium]|nr:type II secretion system minor pseudopilin GspK [Gammaproteobacteria bacterium]